MRRANARVWIVILLLCAIPALAVNPSPATAYSTEPAATTVPPTQEPSPTLAGGRTLAECINSAPRPGCVTRTDTDTHQLATFTILMVGMAFIGWRVFRSVRRRDRSAP